MPTKSQVQEYKQNPNINESVLHLSRYITEGKPLANWNVTQSHGWQPQTACL